MATWETVCEILADLPDGWRLIATKRAVREFLET